MEKKIEIQKEREREEEKERRNRKNREQQQRSVALTCDGTAGNADAMDPSGTRRHHWDADYSKRKGESSSWT